MMLLLAHAMGDSFSYQTWSAVVLDGKEKHIYTLLQQLAAIKMPRM